MSPLLKISLVILSLLYPFIVYWGLQHGEATWLLWMMASLFILRLVTATLAQERYFLVLAAFTLGFVVYGFGEKSGLKLYPVIINLSLLVLFASSLFGEMSIIEKFARIKEPKLPEKGIVYTRKVTQVWCVFFAVNTILSLITVLSRDDALWFWYNGVLAYVLTGMLMAGEWLVRQRVKGV